MRSWGVPRVVVTDKLKSDDVALRDDCSTADHRSHKGLNNRAEASHRHTRRREKIMARFKSPGHAQRFLSAHDQIATIFRPKRRRLSARSFRHARPTHSPCGMTTPPGSLPDHRPVSDTRTPIHQLDSAQTMDGGDRAPRSLQSQPLYSHSQCW